MSEIFLIIPPVAVSVGVLYFFLQTRNPRRLIRKARAGAKGHELFEEFYG